MEPRILAAQVEGRPGREGDSRKRRFLVTKRTHHPDELDGVDIRRDRWRRQTLQHVRLSAAGPT